MGILLEANAFSVGYQRRNSREFTTVVRDATFSVAAGQTVALVGQSGSGKSTIAQAVAWRREPTARLRQRLEEPRRRQRYHGWCPTDEEVQRERDPDRGERGESERRFEPDHADLRFPAIVRRTLHQSRPHSLASCLGWSWCRVSYRHRDEILVCCAKTPTRPTISHQ